MTTLLGAARDPTTLSVCPFSTVLKQAQARIDGSGDGAWRDDAHRLSDVLGDRRGLQLSCWIFLWMLDKLADPRADAHCFADLAEAWVVPPADADADAARASTVAAVSGPAPVAIVVVGGVQPAALTPPAVAAPAGGGERSGQPSYMAVFLDRVQFLAGAQTALVSLHGLPSLVQLNAFGQESMAIKNHFAWSVPSNDALVLVAKHAPLVEIGAGSGYWASLLQVGLRSCGSRPLSDRPFLPAGTPCSARPRRPPSPPRGRGCHRHGPP